MIRAGARDAAPAGRADVITTEVIRQGLDVGARQMKRTLVRTAFSPVIYEVLDFAAAIYDSGCGCSPRRRACRSSWAR